jgi:hypothetical protein
MTRLLSRFEAGQDGAAVGRESLQKGPENLQNSFVLARSREIAAGFGRAVVIRADFSDAEARNDVRQRIESPHELFRASVTFLDDRSAAT